MCSSNKRLLSLLHSPLLAVIIGTFRSGWVRTWTPWNCTVYLKQWYLLGSNHSVQLSHFFCTTVPSSPLEHFFIKIFSFLAKITFTLKHSTILAFSKLQLYIIVSLSLRFEFRPRDDTTSSGTSTAGQILTSCSTGFLTTWKPVRIIFFSWNI